MKHCAYPWQQMLVDLTGDVVPCCYWSGYGNFGVPLGNTNKSSIEDIWNGEGYQNLRQAWQGEITDNHPCGNCLSYRWAAGNYPSFEWPSIFQPEVGHCFICSIGDDLQNLTNGDISEVKFYEDDKLLGPGSSAHDKIRREGKGAYSVWANNIYFSASDNSNPAINGRIYKIVFNEFELTLSKSALTNKALKNALAASNEYKNKETQAVSKPSIISLISTADCNIDCPACSQNKVRDLSVQHREETIPNILNIIPYMTKFTWHGGEPYLIKALRNFINNFESTDNPVLNFGFTTNATMLNEREIKKLKKFHRTELAISIDSFNPETFKKIRPGATLDRVVRNVVSVQENLRKPNHRATIGMIICKSNFVELGQNLKAVFDLGLYINLSPVVIEPSAEMITVFENFKEQTKGWHNSLAEAKDILSGLEKLPNGLAFSSNTISMVEELENIHKINERRHAKVSDIKFNIFDQHKVLDRMIDPALILKVNGVYISYKRLSAKSNEVNLAYPVNFVDEIVKSSDISSVEISLTPDLYYDFTYLAYLAETKIMNTYDLTINDTVIPITRRKNILMSNYGMVTPDGMHPKSAEEIRPSQLVTSNHIKSVEEGWNKINEFVLDQAKIKLEEGFCHIIELKEVLGDFNYSECTFKILEGDQLLRQNTDDHSAIREFGNGRYSCWGEFIYFSSLNDTGRLNPSSPITLQIFKKMREN